MKAQRLSIDANAYVVDETTGERVLDTNNRAIKAKRFGGIRKGSRIFLAEDIDTVIKEAAQTQKA